MFFSVFCLNLVYAQKKKEIITPRYNPGLRFTENLGQLDKQVKYNVVMNSGNIFFEDNRVVYFLYDYNKFKEYHYGGAGKYIDKSIRGHAYHVEFLNGNTMAIKTASDMVPFYENFFLGNDKSKWKSNVHSYKRILYKDIYNGIDYEAVTDERRLKYNYYIKPGANYKDIRLKYKGVEKLKVENGELIIQTSFSEIKEDKPYAYQNINGSIIPIPCKYVLNGSIVSFELLTAFDPKYELIIDPTLVFAAQSGSTADNFGMTATYDSDGNLYSGGTVFDIGYPYITGSYSNVFNGPVISGNTDLVISKYNSGGTNMLYSTYLGGSGSEIVTSLIVDINNNLCLYGSTGSSNFPMLANSYDNTFNGGTYLSFEFNGTTFTNGTDIFISKFNSGGTNLLASTYIGGSDNDGVNHTNSIVTYTSVYQAQTCSGPVFIPTVTEHKADSLQYNYGDQYRGEIQLDKLGNIYIVSSTRSSNFPTSATAFDNSLGGKQDAVIVKFNSSLSTLGWSSYLGGSENDAGYGIIVTDSLFTYVTGGTYSTDFPTTPGCYNTAYNGGKADGYIVKINPAGSSILKGTYIGTLDYDQSYCIQKDKIGNIYVFGQSLGNMPVVGPVYSNAGSHQFISRFDNQLNNLNMSTVVGSGLPIIDISPSAFSVDNCGNIYLSGWGGNLITGPAMSGMPTTTNAIYPTIPNGFDFYLLALSQNAGSLLYATYFGGNCSKEHVDGGTSRFDPAGIVYQSVCAGCGGQDDFPVPAGKWPCGPFVTCPPGPNMSGNCNNGVFKIDFDINIAVSTISTNTIGGCNPLFVNFTSATSPTNAGSSFIWYFGNGQTNTTNINPTVTYTNPGTYTVSLVVIDPTTCNVKDSTSIYITVLPSPTSSFTSTFVPCTNTISMVNTSTGTLIPNPYVWNWGDATPTINATSPTHSYTAPGIYTITLITTAVNGCTSQATQTVNISSFFPTVSSAIICDGSSTTLTALGATNYTWTPAIGLSNTLISSPIANPSVTTIYTVVAEDNTVNPPCVRNLTTSVIVNPKPTADFSYSINPCGGGVNYYDNSASNIAGWFWTLSPTVTTTDQNPYYFYSNGGNFTVSLVATNQFGCTDTAYKPIVVPIPPPLSVNANSLICLGSSAQLEATGGTSYSWTPTSSLNLANISSPVANPTVSTNYSVVITTSNNCTFLLNTYVNVYNLSSTPIAANASPVGIVKGNASTLIYTGDPGATISWYPSNSVNPKTGYTVQATPERPTTYTVYATKGACRETLYVFVDVFIPGCIEGDAFIPNTFTPNGDGQNDILYVRGLKVDEVYFAVYNRWGEMVFETTDKSKGWDGIYKGKPADVGVFGWYLKVKCYNGEETFKKGNVTLIR